MMALARGWSGVHVWSFARSTKYSVLVDAKIRLFAPLALYRTSTAVCANASASRTSTSLAVKEHWPDVILKPLNELR